MSKNVIEGHPIFPSVPFNFRKASIRGLVKRDHNICWLCNRPVKKSHASRDHVLPKKFNGADTPDNLRLAHKKCNADRGHSLLPYLKPFFTNSLDLDGRGD